MKAVILAGGFGTRISEETHLRPKPMVEIGGRPILWHILKIYSSWGINEFVVCCGYKGYLIKEYFANYFLHMSDVSIDLSNNSISVLNKKSEDWKVTLVDTGEATMTGGRLLRVRDYLQDAPFHMTYGDGLADVDLDRLTDHFLNSGALAAVTAVQPPGRYGSLTISDEEMITGFQEKPQGDGAWINGGFFILDPQVFEYIEGDMSSWEQEPLKCLARDNQLTPYFHRGFWQSMDTLRDRQTLEKLWESGNPPWKRW